MEVRSRPIVNPEAKKALLDTLGDAKLSRRELTNLVASKMGISRAEIARYILWLVNRKYLARTRSGFVQATPKAAEFAQVLEVKKLSAADYASRVSFGKVSAAVLEILSDREPATMLDICDELMNYDIFYSNHRMWATLTKMCKRGLIQKTYTRNKNINRVTYTLL